MLFADVERLALKRDNRLERRLCRLLLRSLLGVGGVRRRLTIGARRIRTECRDRTLQHPVSGKWIGCELDTNRLPFSDETHIFVANIDFGQQGLLLGYQRKQHSAGLYDRTDCSGGQLLDDAVLGRSQLEKAFPVALLADFFFELIGLVEQLDALLVE
jgi:hypothetical protein